MLLLCLTVYTFFFIGYSYSAGNATTCLECTDMPKPQDCQTVTTCASTDVCYVQQIITSGGLILYNSGCMYSSRCEGRKRDILEVTENKSRLSFSDIIVCQECCQEDYCNDQGCGTVASKQPQRGPVCFQCAAQNDPNSCRDIAICDLGHVCSIVQYTQNKVWETGCLTTEECSANLDQVGTSTLDCAQCCTHDYCNTNCTNTNNIIKTPSTPTHRSTVPVTANPTILITSSSTSKTTTSLPTTLSTTPSPTTEKTTPSPTTKTTTGKTTPSPTTETTTPSHTTIETTHSPTTELTTHPHTTKTTFLSHTTTATSSSHTTTFHPINHVTTESTRVSVMSTTAHPTDNVFTIDKACPYKPTDLIFVLDGSGSEHVTNFNTQLQFVRNFTNQFEIGPNNTRVSLVTFATTVHSELFLNNNLNKSEVFQHITNTKYPDGETNTHLALNYVNHVTLSHDHDGRNVSKIVIVLTDGRSLEPELTVQSANVLKNNALVTTIAIGIGQHVDPVELLAISSDANHTFQVNDFDALPTILTELSETACNVCKNDMSDICFVLDSSGSEGALNFNKQLEFVNMVVNEFSFEGDLATQVCVVTYSTTANTDIALGQYHSKDQLQSNVLRIPYRDGETMTNLGLTEANRDLLRYHNHGARQTANKVVIVLTDGRSTEPSRTAHSANVLQKKGVDMFAIGIGNHVDEQELETIASDNDHVLRVNSFDQLNSIHQQLVDKICAEKVTKTTLPPVHTHQHHTKGH